MPDPADAGRAVPMLFSPFALRGLSLTNRIVVSPMCQYSGVDGCATDWHTIHLGQLALGGAGLLFIEATAVEPVGRITAGCLGLWDDATEASLARVVRALRLASDMPVGIQLGHAGRKGSSGRPWEGGQLMPPEAGGWQPVAPSAVAHLEHEATPRALTLADLGALRQRFVDAVRRAARIGLQAIEVHAAHGYLLHQFLSPIANHRTDAYGGDLDNRMRFPLEVFEAMRAAWPAERPMGVRVSCTDWVDGGWDLEQTLTFAHALKARGCDWIDASSGGVSPRQSIPVGPGYQVPFASRIRAETGLPVIAVGLITEAAQAEAVLTAGHADLVALARGMLYDPRWAWHAAAELGAHAVAPRQYWRAAPREQRELFGPTPFGQR